MFIDTLELEHAIVFCTFRVPRTHLIPINQYWLNCFLAQDNTQLLPLRDKIPLDLAIYLDH